MATVFVVYLSAVNAGYLPIDDGDMLQSIRSGGISIPHLFLKGGREYYRPLSTLSLLGDFHLFGGKIAGYHLGNILLHLLNTLLMYHLARLYVKEDESAGYYALFVGLLFAVHPVNSETVVWISCRPDLLCCFFSLLCLVMAFKAESGCRPVVYAGLFLFFLCSLLSKEASLFLPIVVACRFLLVKKNVDARNAVYALSALALSASVYLLLRKGFPLVSVPVRAVSRHSGNSTSMTGMDAISSAGFYIRKLFYPFPLNVAITEIDSIFHACLSLLFVAAAVVLWKKQAMLRFPLCFLGTSLIPPIGAMLLLPLWTPYAERYLYLPSVAFALVTVVVLCRFGRRVPRSLTVGIIVVLALTTACRVLLWTQPLRFWQDTVAKSPTFGTARLVLASEYLKAGQYGEAEKSLELAVRLGLPRKERQSAMEIRKQLEERTGRSNGAIVKERPSLSPLATSLAE
jgi:hypothetical protein